MAVIFATQKVDGRTRFARYGHSSRVYLLNSLYYSDTRAECPYKWMFIQNWVELFGFEDFVDVGFDFGELFAAVGEELGGCFDFGG